MKPLLWVVSGPASLAAQQGLCTEFPDPLPALAWPAGPLRPTPPHQPYTQSPTRSPTSQLSLRSGLLPHFAPCLKTAKGLTHCPSWMEGRTRQNRVGSASMVPGRGEERTGSSGIFEARRELNIVAPLLKEDAVRNPCAQGISEVTPGNASVDPKYVAKCADAEVTASLRGGCLGQFPEYMCNRRSHFPQEPPKRHSPEDPQ